MNVWRRSWKRQDTPARFLAASHAGADKIRKLRNDKVRPEAIIANACFYVFLDAARTFSESSAERIAARLGHDWHSLKNLTRVAHRKWLRIA